MLAAPSLTSTVLVLPTAPTAPDLLRNGRIWLTASWQVMLRMLLVMISLPPS